MVLPKYLSRYAVMVSELIEIIGDRMNSNCKGNIALGQAVAYFTAKEYIVSLPLNDSQWYDMIIEKDGVFKTIQVKYTSQLDKSEKYYKCYLRSISGTSRKPIYSVIDTPVDYLFCYCDNGDKYLIPAKEIPNKSCITLTKEKIRRSFDTSNYYII